MDKVFVFKTTQHGSAKKRKPQVAELTTSFLDQMSCVQKTRQDECKEGNELTAINKDV